MGPITLLMLKHHEFLNSLLENFENSVNKKSKPALDIFDAFKINLQKHFSIEEANIFPVTDIENKKELADLKNLLKDHKDLIETIGVIREELIEGNNPNLTIFQDLLYAHELREVESFYPHLDKRLSEEQKNQIISAVKNTKFGYRNI